VNPDAPEGWAVAASLVTPSYYSCYEPGDKSWMRKDRIVIHGATSQYLHYFY
jgi:hypothetical protein